MEYYSAILLEVFFFFFQAEDGIRDVAVTGVQTCALPISGRAPAHPRPRRGGPHPAPAGGGQPALPRDRLRPHGSAGPARIVVVAARPHRTAGTDCGPRACGAAGPG